MVRAIPIFRIFDYQKAIEFYVDWLGFEVLTEHTFGDNFPLYLIIALGDLQIHLTEHHGDCSPGAKVFIENFTDLKAYHEKITGKDYKYNKPGIGPAFWDASVSCMEVTDPFGNKIMFTGK